MCVRACVCQMTLVRDFWSQVRQLWTDLDDFGVKRKGKENLHHSQ